MKSKSLLAVIGALVIKHRNCPLSFKKQRMERLIKLYLLYYLMQKNEQIKERRYWVRDIFQENQRILQGASNHLIDEMRKNDREKYFNFLRMYPETFDEILNIVGPKIQKMNSVMRQSVSAKIRLELTIRYLASGDSMTSLSYMFRVGKNTVSEIIAETCEAIWESLKDIVFIKPTEENWKRIAEEFNEKWNFTNCIGAIDGKHIIIQVYIFVAFS